MVDYALTAPLPRRGARVALLVLLLSLLSFQIVNATRRRGGGEQLASGPLPPHSILFVTLHGDKSDTDGNAIARFSLSGCSANGSALMTAMRLDPVALSISGSAALLMPRGLAFLPPDTLLVASASDTTKGGPKGAIFAASMRDAAAASGPAPLSVPAWLFADSGCDHPYGIASPGGVGAVYVSNQGNGDLLTFDPGHIDPSALLPHPAWPPQLGNCGAGGDGTGGVRGVAATSELVFVACRDANAVYALSPADGSLQFSITEVRAPIGLLWGDAGGRPGLFIGGEAGPGKAERDTVFAAFWDAGLRRVTTRYEHRDGGGHAAGLARVGAALLVLGQEKGALYQFDAGSGAFVGQLAERLDRPEWMLPWKVEVCV